MNIIKRQTTKADGFTLVELLIVVVVIAILAVISVLAYNGVQNRAIDSRRDHDINQYQKALATALVLDGTIPVTTGNAYLGSSGNGARPFEDAIIEKGYLPKRLLDPVYSNGHATSGYLYYNTSNTNTFFLGDNDPHTYAIRFIKANPPATGSSYFCLTSKGVFQAGTQPSAAYPNQCVQG